MKKKSLDGSMYKKLIETEADKLRKKLSLSSETNSPDLTSIWRSNLHARLAMVILCD
jgi:hypothetical protein